MQYPNRHTPQSWRDRWVKYVSNRPRPNVPQENPPPDVRAGASPGGDSRPVDQPPRSHAGPSNVQPTPARSPDSTPGKQAQGRTRFTNEDDEALLKMTRDTYETAAAKGEPVRGLDGNKIFEDFAAKVSSVSPSLHHTCVHISCSTNWTFRTSAIQHTLGATGG